MLRKIEIGDIWLKAAVLGSLWASSEILLGSFLHNLRIPMAGTLLSALGAAILISGFQFWPEKGLFWRTALICSAMKSISPSAVIVGPMVGIFMEGVLLESAVQVFGRHSLGLIVGGALAVSWTLVQKVISTVFTFGLNVIELYKGLYSYAAGNLGVENFGPFDLVIALFAVQMLAGAAVAAAAVFLGRRARGSAPGPADLPPLPQSRYLEIDPIQRFSIILLCFNITAIFSGMWLLSRHSPLISLPFVALYIVFCLLRYRRSMNRLKRPVLWIGLAALVILSGLFLNGWQQDHIWSWGGMRTGLVMTVRAVLVILGFLAVSIELRNPRVLNWFMRKSIQDFPKALGIAFEILPQFIAILSGKTPGKRSGLSPGKRSGLSPGKRSGLSPGERSGLSPGERSGLSQICKRPAAILPELLHHADRWLAFYRESEPMRRKVIFLTGRSGEGKTTTVIRVVDRLRDSGYAVAGVYAPAFWRGGERSGFDLVRIGDGGRVPLCRMNGAESDVSVGPYHFDSAGLDFGNRALSPDSLLGADFIIVDEVGPLELRGEGWAEALDEMVSRIEKPMLWVVRKQVLREVSIRWLTHDPVVLDVKNTDVESIVNCLVSLADLT